MQTMSGLRKAITAGFESILSLEARMAEEARRSGELIKFRRVKVSFSCLQAIESRSALMLSLRMLRLL